MKTYMRLLVIFLMTGSVFAQQNLFKNGEKKIRPNAGPRQEKFKIDYSTEPSTTPSTEMDVNEFLLQRKDVQGKVVELTFDKVVSLKQAGEGYTATVTYENPRMTEGLNLQVPPDGLELFEKLSKPNIRSRESVYIQVLTPYTVKVLGTRHSRNKPEGERYNW